MSDIEQSVQEEKKVVTAMKVTPSFTSSWICFLSSFFSSLNIILSWVESCVPVHFLFNFAYTRSKRSRKLTREWKAELQRKRDEKGEKKAKKGGWFIYAIVEYFFHCLETGRKREERKENPHRVKNLETLTYTDIYTFQIEQLYHFAYTVSLVF